MRSVVIVAWLTLLSAQAQQPLLIGYYAGDGRNLEEHRIEQLTHLIWCFGHVRNDSMVISPAQDPIIARMVRMKARNPDLKVLLSVGGWGGCANCSETFARETGRRTFAASVRALLDLHHADGIDLDWEYPAVPGPPGHSYSDADRHHFTLLVRELRRALGDRYEISFAAGGTDECLLKGFEWDRIMPLVDRMHIMSYDLVHGYSTTTGHHTPLYACTGQELSADGAVQLLDSLQVPLEKVVIGSAFYVRIWKDVAPVNNGLFQPGTFSHSISASAVDTTLTAERGWSLFRDKEACAAYAYNSAARQFATYDDPASVAAKAGYVRSKGLGGIMFWQLIDDDPVNGLLNTMHRALRSP
ncbi:MAG: glycoside hydrolase [Flavobacteriales bacterium]|nr:glycoside hydrolase [Flavobacteriales bacterium]